MGIIFSKQKQYFLLFCHYNIFVVYFDKNYSWVQKNSCNNICDCCIRGWSQKYPWHFHRSHRFVLVFLKAYTSFLRRIVKFRLFWKPTSEHSKTSKQVGLLMEQKQLFRTKQTSLLFLFFFLTNICLNPNILSELLKKCLQLSREFWLYLLKVIFFEEQFSRYYRLLRVSPGATRFFNYPKLLFSLGCKFFIAAIYNLSRVQSDLTSLTRIFKLFF